VQESIASVRPYSGSNSSNVATWRFRRACVLTLTTATSREEFRRAAPAPRRDLSGIWECGEYDGGDFSAGCEVACSVHGLGRT